MKATAPQREQIRALFAQLGGRMSIPDLAHAVLKSHIYTAEQQARLTRAQLFADCRRALRESDASGLPFAARHRVEARAESGSR